jgi:hypothetical protein
MVFHQKVFAIVLPEKRREVGKVLKPPLIAPTWERWLYLKFQIKVVVSHQPLKLPPNSMHNGHIPVVQLEVIFESFAEGKLLRCNGIVISNLGIQRRLPEQNHTIRLEFPILALVLPRLTPKILRFR